MAKRDWAKIAFEYETTTLTLEDIAAEHGIPYRTVRLHSSNEHWSERRKKHVAETTARARQELEQKLALRYVAETELDLSRIEKTIGALEEQIGLGLQANSLDAAAGKLVELIKAKRLIMGEATERTDQQISGPRGGPIQVNPVPLPIFGLADPMNHFDAESTESTESTESDGDDTEPDE